ncbi:MAG: antitoxin [Anaeromyxobacter sp. RBG_16_69_14]|nr:MAG: antitoxin [Anaeromyxobacter sp. RBG_16_69_14]
MKQVNIHEAKTQLSRLIEEVEAGGEVIVARAGKPVAKLSPIRGKRRRRRLGLLDGKFKIPADFDAPLPDEVLAAFHGRVR